MGHPRIVIRKAAAEGGHHGGAWKVAYADFVTALMAMFIVLWLVNSSKQVREAVAGYFKDPAGSSETLGAGEGAGGRKSFTVTKDNMGKLKDELQSAVHKMSSFEKLKDQIEITVTGEGLQVELMETEKGAFFASGSSLPSADGIEILSMLAKELGELPNSISIEGHTDSKPYAGQAAYTNWELSADRANAARRVMGEQGLAPRQVTQIRGYADQRLRNPKAPEAASNRRISLIVHYLEEDKPKPGSEAPAGK